MLGDEGVFRKWLRLEMDTLHADLVTHRRLLADLLAEETPAAPSRNGQRPFDREELRRLAARMPTELRYTLRLPIQVYTDSEVGDAVYVHDRHVAEALAILGYPVGTADPQGRLWFGRALGLQVLRDWPTCAQVVYL